MSSTGHCLAIESRYNNSYTIKKYYTCMHDRYIAAADKIIFFSQKSPKWENEYVHHSFYLLWYIKSEVLAILLNPEDKLRKYTSYIAYMVEGY